MEPAGTIADRAYAPKPGAPARPAIVRCKKLASGWLAEVEPGETLLTQKRKHYRLRPASIAFLDPPMLATEDMNIGISRWPITLRN